MTRVLERSVDELTREVVRRVWGLPGYDDEHMRRDELAGYVAPNLRTVIGSLAGHGDPGPDAVEAAERIGQARALQGVPVDAVMQSWATAERAVLDHLLEHAERLPPAELRAGVNRLGHVVGSLTRHSVDAYRRTQEEVTAHYDRLATDLVARIVGEQPADPEEVRRRARTIGAEPATPHAAVAVGIAGSAVPRASAYLRIQRHLLATVGARIPGRVLVGAADEHPLLLVPVPHGRTALAGQLAACVRDPHRPDPVVLGLSDQAAPLPVVGPACQEARSALEVGLRLGVVDQVVGFGDVAAEVMLIRNPDVAAVLDERIRPLLRRPELLDTLRAYLSCGMSARKTARALFVHPNTVPYRLRLIERLLGRPLTDARALADVILALRHRDLLPPDESTDRGPVQAP